MKMMKGLIAALLLIACGSVVLAADNAPIPDEPLPQEVKALIGMKIPPKVLGRRGGDIPNFIEVGGGMLNRKIGSEVPKAELGYDEGVVDRKWPVFIVSAGHNDRTLEILDVQLLPKNLINWRYANGKIMGAGKGNHFIFSARCQYGKGDDRIIFGLEDPTVEHDGMSTRIERAWEVDPLSGQIKSISTKNITCAILGE